MNKMVKLMSVLALTAATATSFAPSSFADPVESQSITAGNTENQSAVELPAEGDFGPGVVLSEEEVKDLKEEAALNANVDQPKPLEERKLDDSISIMDITGFSFSFDGWGSGASRKSNYYIDTDETSDVYLTVTQWANEILYPYEADMTYYLESSTGRTTSPRNIVGNFKDGDTETVGWSNVLPGRYWLVITNSGDHQASGIGYVRAYYQ